MQMFWRIALNGGKSVGGYLTEHGLYVTVPCKLAYYKLSIGLGVDLVFMLPMH